MTALSVSLIVNDFIFAFIEFVFLQHFLAWSERDKGRDPGNINFFTGLVKFLLLPVLFLGFFSLNCTETNCLKNLLYLSVVSLFYSDL